jgi:hypothetical protein
MKPEDFEELLQKQSLRQIPAEWREEILLATCAEPVPTPTLRSRPSWLAMAFWPSPKAWAGLAATWLVILAVHLATRDQPRSMVKRPAPLTPELRLVLKQQGKQLAELIRPSEVRDAEKPKTVPAPRSARRQDEVIA